MAERIEKYSELKAQFAKEKDPDAKNQEKAMIANRIPIENPQPVVVPRVTFDEHIEQQQHRDTRVKHSLSNIFIEEPKDSVKVNFSKEESDGFFKEKSNGFFNDNNIKEKSKLNYEKENKKEDYIRIRNRDTGHIKYVTRDRYNKYKEEKKNRKEYKS